jgi:hypothetical protein
MVVVNEDDENFIPIALSDTEKTLPGTNEGKNNVNIEQDEAYKKIMDIAFYDEAAAQDAKDEEENPTPKEFL